MLSPITINLATFVGALYLLGPLAVRWTFRFAARCRPMEVPLLQLPGKVAMLFEQRIPELRELGFELVGSYDCGELAKQTYSYVAYFCNRRTNDFANVSAMVTPKQTAGYLEFSTHFKNGQCIATNTNCVLPLTPPNPDVRVFRLPEIQDARTLLHTHHRFVDKYAPGLWAQGEPRGEEIHRLVRVVENYGPRHARIGYMGLAEDGHSYQLTWKGAFLMTWRGLWPVSLFRRIIHRHAMQSELRSLASSGVAALQKA
jgi:hypothetical protein